VTRTRRQRRPLPRERSRPVHRGTTAARRQRPLSDPGLLPDETSWRTGPTSPNNRSTGDSRMFEWPRWPRPSNRRTNSVAELAADINNWVQSRTTTRAVRLAQYSRPNSRTTRRLQHRGTINHLNTDGESCVSIQPTHDLLRCSGFHVPLVGQLGHQAACSMDAREMVNFRPPRRRRQADDDQGPERGFRRIVPRVRCASKPRRTSEADHGVGL
jgi:hypothetical protein